MYCCAKIVSVLTAVCLLSVVLLLPYLAGGHASIFVGGVGLCYSCLVLPMVISANYRYPVSALKAFAIKVEGKFPGFIATNFNNYIFLSIMNNVYQIIRGSIANYFLS